MHDTLIHLGLIVAGGFLFWLGNWNHQKEDDDRQETSNAKYVLLMLSGILSAITGILLLLGDLISLF